MIRQKLNPTGLTELNALRRTIVVCLLVCLIVVLELGQTAASIVCPPWQPTAANEPPGNQLDEKEIRVLEMGRPIERELVGGQSHRYQIDLAAGQYLSVVVDQRGIDVVATLLGPDGKKLIEVDSPNGVRGPEPVSWIVETAGRHRLEVGSLEKGAKPGRYEVKIVELRVSTERDRELVEAGNLYNESISLRGKGQYDQAISRAARASTLREKGLGAEHPDTADSLNLLAELYHTKGDYAQAEPLYRRALAIREKTLGAEHSLTAVSLNNLAVLYYDKGDYAQAEPLHRRALAIREKTLGPEHIDTAHSLNNLASLYRAKSDYTQAEPLFRRALAIREKTLGPEHPDTAASLNFLASLYRAKGDYAQAEPLLRRALAIREKTLGAEHPATAGSLNTLAAFYKDKGDYEQAEQLYRRALAIREKALGAEHPDTAFSLNKLAELYHDKGEYAQAEPLFRHGLAIREKTLGAEHPDTASSLNNLAELYRVKGDYTQAEPLYRRGLAIREKTLGSEHLDTAQSLAEFGLLYVQKGDYAQAEPLFRRSLIIYEKALGADHSYTATLINSLAVLYHDMGDYAQAEPLYRRALATIEKSVGAEHPHIASSLNNLAGLYQDKGDYPQAETLYRRALAIREKRLGADHPNTAVLLNNLAGLYETTGDISQAVALRSRAQAIEERNISVNLAAGSERQKLAYLTTLARSTNQSVYLHVHSAPENSIARDLALTAILQRKGRVLDAMNDNMEALRRRAVPQDQVLFDQLKDARAQLAKLVFGGPQKASPLEYQQAIKKMEESVETLEAEIGGRSSEFRAQSRPVTLKAVQSALPKDSALIEIVSFSQFVRRSEKATKPRYAAYALFPDGDPRWVDLGEAEAIDQAIAEFREALHNSKSTNLKALARRLDEKVMRPVRTLLGQTRNVLLSPDASLNLVPFAALVDEENHYLVERYSFTYLTSGRDLLRFRSEAQIAKAPMIMADPDFGEGPMTAASTRILDLRQAYFSPLSGTAEEAKALKRILPQATVLTRDQASETALKQVAGPSILHIATHGFFLSDNIEETEETGRRRKLLQQSGALASLGANLENPLLRSGLGLAGANLHNSGDDDGILTAMEVAGLNLWGTKLVTLSACETGVGEVRNGEGVYGLRRALTLAGAETQVMSLWPVSDRGTRELMIGYYKALQAGQGRSEAMRQVQLRMLKEPRRRHPFYWASFIVSGEWANLDGKR